MRLVKGKVVIVVISLWAQTQEKFSGGRKEVGGHNGSRNSALKYQILSSAKGIFDQMTHVLCVTAISLPATKTFSRKDGMIAIVDASVPPQSRPQAGTDCPRLILEGSPLSNHPLLSPASLNFQ